MVRSADGHPGEPRGSGSNAGGWWHLDWRMLVGLVSVVGGLFIGSRVLVTQDQLAAAETRLREKSIENDARIWAELNRREQTSFRRPDWEDAKEWIKAELKRLEEANGRS